MINSSRAVISATELVEPGPHDWFISDHHFGHANIIKHAQRPFSGVAAMNEAMITQWNAVVEHTDRVIHLGDLYWGADPEQWKAVRRRLNGKILLVPGNHDPAQALLDAQVVDVVLPPICEVPYRCKRTGHKRYFVLCHYPLAEWHYDMIQEISEIMGLPPTLDWVYMATIHGKCFQAKISPMHARHCSRIHAMQMKQLIDLPGFRWIETGDGDTIDIGIEHDEAVAKQKHAISAARG